MKVKFSTLIILAAAMMVSCAKQDANEPRKESFELYATSDCSGKPLSAFCVDVKGNSSTLYLKTNVTDFDVFWQDALLEPWAEVVLDEGFDPDSPAFDTEFGKRITRTVRALLL